MPVPDDRIDNFIDLWERAFGERSARDDAKARAHQLLELYHLINQKPPTERRATTQPPPAEDDLSKGAVGGG